MTTRKQAMVALGDLVVALTALTADDVRLAYDNGPRPSGSHLVLRPLPDLPSGLAQRNGGDVQQRRVLAISVEAIGTTAAAALDLFALVGQSDAPAASAELATIGVQSIGPIQTTTAVLGSGYEPRAVCTVTVDYIASTTTAGATDADTIIVDAYGDPVPDPTATVAVLTA